MKERNKYRKKDEIKSSERESDIKIEKGLYLPL